MDACSRLRTRLLVTRVALHVGGELAVRATRVLLAESGVEVGLFDDESKSGRLHQVEALNEWDVLVVEEMSATARPHVDAAFELAIPVVLATETPPLSGPSVTMVVGVLEGARLAAALADMGLVTNNELIDARLAWTVPGPPLTDGVAVTFPDPIGPLWAHREPHPTTEFASGGLAAPTDGQWRGITARLATGSGDGVHQQTYGVVDDRQFLDGVVLAAAALAAAQGAYPPGHNGPGDSAGIFLRIAQESGMDIASFAPSRG